MKTLKELHVMLETIKARGGKRLLYTLEFKQGIVALHYKTGRTLFSISKEFDINPAIIYPWKKAFGKDATGYIHGTKIRYDVRTKCLAIQDELDNGLTVIQIANKYKITRQQYASWKSKFADRYEEHIEHMTDGIPHLIATKKHVYGSENIEIVQELMNDQVKEYEITIACLQKHGMGSKEVLALQVKLEARKVILEDM